MSNDLRSRCHHSAVLGIAALATGCTLGCAIPIRVAELDVGIARDATPVAIESALSKLDDPATKRQIRAMLASPEMPAIHQELVAGLIDGTLATLSDGERSERIGALATNAMAGMLRGASRELPQATENMTRSAMNGALDAALDPGRRRDMESSVSVLVSAGVRAAADGLREAEIGKTLSAEISEEIGPAFKKSMRDDVAPALAELLENEDLRRELGETARVLGREMVLGATDALAQKKEPAPDGSLLARATSLAKEGSRLFGSAAWLLVLVILAMFVWIAKLMMQAKRYRNDAERRVAATRLLEEATRAAEGKPWAKELIEVLQQRVRDSDLTPPSLRPANGDQRGKPRSPRAA